MLYEGYSRDSRLIEFKNMLDVNIHSFHDCDRSVIDNYKSLNKVEKSVYLEHNNVSYSQTIRTLLEELEALGVTHLFFSQDDTFSVENDKIDFVELLDYATGFNENFMLNLWYELEFLNYLDLPCEDHKSFGVYHTNTKDFARADKFAMDDAPYIATMDIVRRVYGDYYLNDHRTIWRVEEHLAEYCASFSIPRFILDKTVFRNYNIIGRNITKGRGGIAELFRRKILIV
jgi:hypothetical protein